MKKLSQADRLLKLLSDGKPHSTPEIQLVVYGADHLGTANIKARIDDLRNRGYEIPRAEQDKSNPSVYWYQLGNPPKPKPRLVPQVVEIEGIKHVRLVPVQGTE